VGSSSSPQRFKHSPKTLQRQQNKVQRKRLLAKQQRQNTHHHDEIEILCVWQKEGARAEGWMSLLVGRHEKSASEQQAGLATQTSTVFR
jgi:hypothetical protein